MSPTHKNVKGFNLFAWALTHKQPKAVVQNSSAKKLQAEIDEKTGEVEYKAADVLLNSSGPQSSEDKAPVQRAFFFVGSESNKQKKSQLLNSRNSVTVEELYLPDGTYAKNAKTKSWIQILSNDVSRTLIAFYAIAFSASGFLHYINPHKAPIQVTPAESILPWNGGVILAEAVRSSVEHSAK